MGKGKNGKGFARAYSSKDYKEFVLDMDSQFISQNDYPEEKVSLCHIDILFRFSTNRRTDADNKLSTVLDALQECGILEDDRWQLTPDIRIRSEKNYRDGFTIKIMEVSDEYLEEQKKDKPYNADFPL